MSIGLLFTLLDPAASIRVNGVPTTDFVTKLGVFFFTTFFPVLGAVLAFLPQKKIEPLLRYASQEAGRIAGKGPTRR